jgi:hypothetical protein
MNIQARKLHFIQEFLRVADEELVAKLERILVVERKKQLQSEIYPMSIDEYNDAIDESENDFKNGRVTSSQNVLKLIDSWK